MSLVFTQKIQLGTQYKVCDLPAMHCIIINFLTPLCVKAVVLVSIVLGSCIMVVFVACFKADTQEGFCSQSMLQGHARGANFLRVYQQFHGYTSSSGAEFPPHKMLHDI